MSQRYVGALLDMTSRDAATGKLITSGYQYMQIPVADAATCEHAETICEHAETICGGCLDSWAIDYLIDPTTI